MKTFKNYQVLLFVLSMFLPLWAFANQDQQGTVLNCNLKIYRPKVNTAPERIVLEKQGEALLLSSQNRSELQVIFGGDDVTSAYFSEILFLGNIYKENGVDKIKIGIYRTDSASRLREGSPYWVFPVESPYYYLYAHPIVESTFNYKVGGEYSLHTERRIGGRDAARATTIKCR